MRLCLDANCLVAGIASPQGATGRILRNIAAGHVSLVVSPAIEAEYLDVAQRPGVVRLFNRRGVQAATYLAVVRAICRAAERATPTGQAPTCRDPKDEKYLHCALHTGAEYLVTWDDDLLDLGAIGRARIVRPGDFLAAMREAGSALEP